MNKSGEQDIQESRYSDPRNTRRKGLRRSTCAAGRRVCEDAWREKGGGYPHTPSRRRKELDIPLGVKYDKDKPVDIVVDFTGIKAFMRLNG